MKKIFAANWKLFKTPQETRDFFTQFKELAPTSASEVVFFPSAISLEAASTSLKGTNILFGAQNCYFQSQGAFTGENSAQVVKDLGGSYILIGHSERRKVFGEEDGTIAEKVSYVQSLDLTPMLCIGETLQERESKHTFRILETQLLFDATQNFCSTFARTEDFACFAFLAATGLFCSVSSLGMGDG